MRHLGLVVQVVIVAVIVSSPSWALQELGTIGSIEAPKRTAAPRTPAPVAAAKTATIGSKPVSLVIVGSYADVLRRRLKDEAGEAVVLKDTGKYLVSLQADTAPRGTDFQVQGATSGPGKYLAAALDGMETRVLIAEFKRGDEFLGSETVKATGLRANASIGLWNGGTSISAQAFTGWLGQSLDGQNVRKMVPLVLKRLQEFESDEAAERAIEARQVAGRPKEVHRYELVDMLNREKDRRVTLDRAVAQGDKIVARNAAGQEVGVLTVSGLNMEGTRVWVWGASGVLGRKGTLKFSVL